jgi:starch-binding outer membrane protein, SusD/RagB family
MNTYTTFVSGWTRRTSAFIALAALSLVGCKSPDEFLAVTDPDIINPADVQSAAGADAVRLGALARLNSSTSGPVTSTGGESLFLLGGLFSDEYNNGDSFIARQEVDQRIITIQNNFLTDANRAMHRARLAAQQAIVLEKQYNPTAPAANIAEMYFVQAYIETMMAEHYCNGLIFSTITEGLESYGQPITTQEAFTIALAHADSGLALIKGTTAQDVKIKGVLQVTKGRILMNLNRYADAAAAVAGVSTSLQYQELHTATTSQQNQMWSFNVSNRRYSVSTGEGTNGLNFATANDPRLPVCLGGDAACRAIGVTLATRDDLTSPIYVQRLWTTNASPVTIVSGIEARMIEAEAQLKAGQAAASLATLNAARATVTGLAPLTDPGTDAARVDQIFRERAFWMFSTGHRTGDLRRLIRQYGRAANSVFPTGGWHKGGSYGGDVTLPVPQAEQNNPNLPSSATTCIDRVA